MKQFYYTSCRVGESVSGQSGFQVRAISEPLSAEETAACLRALNFKLDVPADWAGPIPIKLLYCSGERTGNLALQSVWLGEDPVTKRAGNYFAHVLCGLDPKINAKSVLEWWRSPNWKCKNQGIDGTQLPAPTLFPAGEAFGDAILKEMTSDSELFAIWEFLLRAWWTRTASGRIFLAVPQEKFVKALWAVCRILPESLWKTLSFSTYEKDAMLSPASVVGLWNPVRPADSIPESCFGGTNASWNLFSGQKSQLPQVSRYVEFLIQCVRTGKFAEADAFHANAPLAVWSRRESSEMFFELVRHPDSLDVTRLKEIANLPNIGRFAMKNEKRFRLLLENFFSCRLLDVWEDSALKRTYESFFSNDEVLREQFRDAVLALLKLKIRTGDLEFLERFHSQWLSRLSGFGFSEPDFWNLFNEAPGMLPEAVYLWAYPRAIRQVFQLGEPSQQIEFLSKWCFHGDDSRCEPQISEILRGNFADVVKLELYRRFFENDFRGNDESYSELYFAWPDWNVQLLAKLDATKRDRFLKHLVPAASATLLSALQARLMPERRGNLPVTWNEDLFRIYCWLLLSPTITITAATAEFARRLPAEQVLAIRDALTRRPDVEQLIQIRTLKAIFEDPETGMLGRLKGLGTELGNVFKGFGRK